MDTNARLLVADALRALELEPEGGEREFSNTALWTRQETRYRLQVALTGELQIENELKQYLRNQVSLCPCPLPNACDNCQKLTRFLVFLGYWSEKPAVEGVVVERQVLPSSEPPVENTTTLLERMGL